MNWTDNQFKKWRRPWKLISRTKWFLDLRWKIYALMSASVKCRARLGHLFESCFTQSWSFKTGLFLQNADWVSVRVACSRLCKTAEDLLQGCRVHHRTRTKWQKIETNHTRRPFILTSKNHRTQLVILSYLVSTRFWKEMASSSSMIKARTLSQNQELKIEWFLDWSRFYNCKIIEHLIIFRIKTHYLPIKLLVSTRQSVTQTFCQLNPVGKAILNQSIKWNISYHRNCHVKSFWTLQLKYPKLSSRTVQLFSLNAPNSCALVCLSLKTLL